MRLFAVVAALVSVAYAENFTVAVGANGTLTYSPESVVAKVGDTIAFRFMSKNHTVTQSTFAKPCEKMTTPTAGIDSGFQSVAAGATEFPEWSFTVDNDTAPFWFFCAQAPHCSKGMVFAVNPSASKTFEAFKANAMGTAAPAGNSSAGTGPSTTGSGPSPTNTAPSAGNGALMMTGSSATMLLALGLLIALTL